MGKARRDAGFFHLRKSQKIIKKKFIKSVDILKLSLSLHHNTKRNDDENTRTKQPVQR